jgi:hypothetical protein
MDLKKVLEIIYKWIYLSRKEIKEDGVIPGVSYILTHSLSFPATRVVLEQFSVIDIFKIVHMVYRMFEGTPIDEVIKQSVDIFYIKLIIVKEAKDVSYECPECMGSGSITCPQCNGEGDIDCYECSGDGCYNCEDYGRETCNECGGDSEISCRECSGDGKIKSDDLEYKTEIEYWVASDLSLYKKLKNLVGDYTELEDEIYDIMNKYKGDVNLLKIDYDTFPENELTSMIGYDIKIGNYFVEDVDFLKNNQELLNSIKVKYYGGSWTIR